MAAYTEALRQSVKAGSVVVDIGTGPGLFAFLACQFGARHVYAIEPNPIIHVAREMAATNGFQKSITFFEALSTELTLPERADVVIADLRGILPLFGASLRSMIDARERLLVLGGTLIPQQDTIWISPVEAENLYTELTRPWDQREDGLTMEAARRLVINGVKKTAFTPEQLLGKAEIWANLDYRTIESVSVRNRLTWQMNDHRVGHGIGAWFESVLVEGVQLSNAPRPATMPRPIYGNIFFPWPQAIELAPGDSITVDLQANSVGDDYIWRWETVIYAQGDESRIKAHFQQSTLNNMPLSLHDLHKRADQFVPQLNEQGKFDLFILEGMQQALPLKEIAQALAQKFPATFPDWKIALNRVGDLATKYSL